MAGCKAQLEIERWIVNYEGRGPDNRLGIIEGEAPEGGGPPEGGGAALPTTSTGLDDGGRGS